MQGSYFTAGHGLGLTCQWSVLRLYLPYLYLAIRRAYDLSRPSAGVRAVLMTFSVIAVLQLYRLFLFFTTYGAI
jgi:hypothetical protein